LAGVKQTATKPSHSRTPLVFAILGLLAAAIAGGTYYYRELRHTSSTRTPEATVAGFLTEVFAPKPDQQKLAGLVCDGWAPQDAVKQTTDQIPNGARVGWQDINLVSTDNDHAIVVATITLTPFQDGDPSDFHPWRFSLIDQNDWKVCGAHPVAG
jgi:hypothetical protein